MCGDTGKETFIVHCVDVWYVSTQRTLRTVLYSQFRFHLSKLEAKVRKTCFSNESR